MKLHNTLVRQQRFETLRYRLLGLHALVLVCLVSFGVLGMPGLVSAQPNPFEGSRPLGVAMPRVDLATSQPSVAIAADGSMLAVWVENVPGDPQGTIIARRFDASGEPIGERLRLARTSANPGPKVGVLADGSFGVAWLAGAGSDQLRFARLPPRREGEVDAFETSVFLGRSNQVYEVLPIDLVTADRSQFSVVATGALAELGLFRPAAPTGQPAWSLDLDIGFSTSGAVAYDPSTIGLVVAWHRSSGAESGRDVLYQRFDGSGQPQRAPRRVNTRLSGDQRNPDVAVYADGRVVVVWQSPADTEAADIFARRFGPDDRPQTGEIWVDQEYPRYSFGDVDSTEPEVTVTGANHCFVIWRTTYLDDTGDGPWVSWSRLGPNLELIDGDRGPGSDPARFETHQHLSLVSPVPAPLHEGEVAVAVVWVSQYRFELAATSFLRLVRAATTGDLQVSVPFRFNESEPPSEIVVSRTGGARGEVAVDYELTSDTAIEGLDFVRRTGQLTWAAGETASRTIPLEVLVDSMVEGTETAKIVWSNPVGAWTGRSFEPTIVRIEDLDPNALGMPRVRPQVHLIEEGDSIRLDVRRYGGASGQLLADWMLEPYTPAMPGVDVAQASGSMGWVDGDLSTRPIHIQTLDDDLIEGWEEFELVIRYGAAPPLTETVRLYLTIVDNDPSPEGTFGLTRSSAQVGEGNGPVAVEVERVGGSRGPATLQYSLYHNGIVYVAPPIFSLHWADGEAEPKPIVIPDFWRDTLDDEEIVDGAVVQLEAVTEGDGRLGQTRNFALEVFDDDTQPGESGRPLSAMEIACAETRLQELSRRLRLNPTAVDRQSWIFAGPTASGDLTGVAALAAPPARNLGPSLLAFSINPEETTLLSNPRRPQLATWSVTRNRVASDLVEPGHEERFELLIDPVAEPPAGDPLELLRIDNVEGSSGLAASAKPGRGLQPLLDPCHELSAYDAHLISVLMRLLEPVGTVDRYHLNLFRGESSNEIWIDLSPQTPGPESPPVIRYRFVVTYDSRGRLARSWLSLAPCTAAGVDCLDGRRADAGLRLRRPRLQGSPSLRPTEALYGDQLGHWIEVDLAQFLLQTSWRSPL